MKFTSIRHGKINKFKVIVFVCKIVRNKFRLKRVLKYPAIIFSELLFLSGLFYIKISK